MGEINASLKWKKKAHLLLKKGLDVSLYFGTMLLEKWISYIMGLLSEYLFLIWNPKLDQLKGIYTKWRSASHFGGSWMIRGGNDGYGSCHWVIKLAASIK